MSSDSKTTLKQLMADNDLEGKGKQIRKKLRRAEFGWHDPRQPWEFNASQVKEVKKVLGL